MFRHIAEVLDPLDMTFQQFIALMILAERGAMSNADLARISQIARQSADQVVKLLESKEWIARDRHPEHQKILLLSITQRGKKALETADAAVMIIEKRMLSGLSTSEKKQFQRQLGRSLTALGGTGLPTGS